jgi:hypothetical protein
MLIGLRFASWDAVMKGRMAGDKVVPQENHPKCETGTQLVLRPLSAALARRSPPALLFDK